MTGDVVQRRAAALEAAASAAGAAAPTDQVAAVLTPDERATVDQLRFVFAHPAVWMEPPDLPVHPAAIDTALDASDLPAAAEGTYYQGWVVRGTSYVPLGTFHLRRAGEVELWAGVPVDGYSRLEVTRQRIGGEQSPGELVLYGDIPSR